MDSLLILTFAAVAIVILSLIEVDSVLFSNEIIQVKSMTESPAVISIPVYEITTRGNLDKPVGVQGQGYGNYTLLAIEQLYSQCPDEVAIFVHGWGLNENQAKERLDRVKMSLENSTYNIPLISFSWDSNITWFDATRMAKDNGPKLADFISNLTNICNQPPHNKEVKVRLIGHSIGSRVILSSLDSLNKTSTWNNNNFKIASVDLMGAAVDNEEVSMDSIDHYNQPMWLHDPNGIKFSYGKFIGSEAFKFSNLHSPEDNVLERYYPNYEGGDRALGENGKQRNPEIRTPSNYTDIDVRIHLKPIDDADAMDGCDFGICELGLEANVGDNHAGYVGFRNLTDTRLLADDGAIDIVVDNWRIS